MVELQIGRKPGITNISDQGHLGGLIDGSPYLETEITNPTLSMNTTERNDVYTTANHFSKMLYRAVTFKATAANPNGYIVLSGNDEKIDGIIIACDGDGRATIGQVFMNVPFLVPPKTDATAPEVAYNFDLSHTHIGDRIIGAGNGKVKPVSEPDALEPAATGAPTNAELLAYNKQLLLFMKGRGGITHVENGGRRVVATFWNK